MRPQDNILKILVTGEGGVGKTTLLYQYVNRVFVHDTSMTIGVQFHTKDITIDGTTYTLQLWDLGGQDRFRFLLPSYTIGARGALLLFDTTMMASLESLDEWVTLCRTNDRKLPILLLGTKIDLEDRRSVPKDYAQGFLRPLNLFDYLEVSAKTGENVEKAFETLVRAIIEAISHNF